MEDAGEVCLRLLTTLKGIQLGKIKDDFGWRFEVREEDGAKVEGVPAEGRNGATTVGQMA